MSTAGLYWSYKANKLLQYTENYIQKYSPLEQACPLSDSNNIYRSMFWNKLDRARLVY